MEPIKFKGYEYDPQTKIRGKKVDQGELFDPKDGLTDEQRFATGDILGVEINFDPSAPPPYSDPL